MGWRILWGALLAASVAGAAEPLPGIVVDFRDGTTQAQIDAWEQAWDVDLTFNSIEGPLDGVAIAQGAALRGHDPETVLAQIRQNPAVESAEVLLTFSVPESEEASAQGPHAQRRDGFPNDPEFDRQWNFQAIHVTEAWKTTHGKGVIVAVIDTGIAYEKHDDFIRVPDLAETKFVPGYDFVNDTEHANDDHGHGTHVAGTIAQSTNNGLGVAGIAFEATLMPIKVLDHFGAGNAADIADAIRFAADHGARVLNLSLGGGLPSTVMERAVHYAHEKGAVVVCAAGNTGRGRVEFPAAYPDSFAVAAVGPDGKRAPYSSYGSALDLAAPGGNKTLGVEGGILQNTLDPRDVSQSIYAWYQGTSMAAPHVAGVAALVFAAGAKTPEEVEAALQKGAVKVAEDTDSEYGAGLLDAQGALKSFQHEDSSAMDDLAHRSFTVSGVLFTLEDLMWVGGLLALGLLSLPRRARIGYLNILFSPGFVLGVGAWLVAWHLFLGSSPASFDSMGSSTASSTAWLRMLLSVTLSAVAFYALGRLRPSLRRFGAGTNLAIAAIMLQLVMGVLRHAFPSLAGWPLMLLNLVLSFLLARLLLRRAIA